MNACDRPGDDSPLRVLYGGTFDPVHNGHLAIAGAARDALGAPVHFMPAADPPHRPAPGATVLQRADMLALATADDPDFRVDLRELRRQGPSYSVETLRELRQELGEAAPVALVIGADSLLGLPGWHEWRALLDLAHFVVADRPGSGLDRPLPPPLAEALAGRWSADAEPLRSRPGGCLLRLRQPLNAVSASQVRGCIAAGGPWRDLVPAAVADYILRQGLYGLHGPQTPRPV